jgi:acetyl esterase/lipase
MAVLAKISYQLRITRVVLRLIQIYLGIIFALEKIWPRSLGIKLFRAGSNLLDFAAWPITKRAITQLEVSTKTVMIGGIGSTWFLPNEVKDSGKVVLYLHGGGFMICSVKTHGSFLATLADNLSCTVIALDYSLSPEKKYPIALEEIAAAYQDLLTMGYSARNIIVGGESAGACLALAMLMQLRDNGMDMPCAAFLDSPLIDLGCSGLGMKSLWRHECVLPIYGPHTNQLYAHTFKSYTGDAGPETPYVSPLFGKFHGLPPLHVSYSEHELLRDDSTRLIATARLQGADITDFCGDWTPHATLAFHRYFPEGKDLFYAVTKFINRHLELVESPRSH